jgi:hypothetical protein
MLFWPIAVSQEGNFEMIKTIEIERFSLTSSKGGCPAGSRDQSESLQDGRSRAISQ